MYYNETFPYYPYPRPYPSPFDPSYPRPFDPWVSTRAMHPDVCGPGPYNPKPPWFDKDIARRGHSVGFLPPISDQDEAFLKSCAAAIKDLIEQITSDQPQNENERLLFSDILICCSEIEGFLRAKGYIANFIISSRGSNSGTRGACGDMVRAIEDRDWGGAADHGPGCIKELKDALR